MRISRRNPAPPAAYHAPPRSPREEQSAVSVDTRSAEVAPAQTNEGLELSAHPTIRIGRAPDNDLAFDDILVSRHHAELSLAPDGSVLVRDLESSNGTFLNGRRIESEPVASGDFIGVGGQTLQVRDGRLRVVSVRHTAWFGAVDLVVRAGGHVILDQVGFA